MAIKTTYVCEEQMNKSLLIFIRKSFIMNILWPYWTFIIGLNCTCHSTMVKKTFLLYI